MIESLYAPFRHWSNTGTVWLYSDPHFGDKDLDKGIAGRPSSDEQVKMINSKVGRADTLIILGDIGDIEYVKKLRGYKVLICGNHDRGASYYSKDKSSILFNEIYTGPLTISEKIILSHEPLNIDWAFNIHGHDHSGRDRGCAHLNVCSDVIGYTPISLNKLIKEGQIKGFTNIHRQTIDKATERKEKRSNG